MLTERKTSLITNFPQLLKIVAKKTSNFRNWEGKKWLAQIYRKNLTDRKLEKTRTRINKIILCISTSSVFTQSFQYQYWKANAYSILTIIELGPPVSEFSTRTSKFYGSIDSEDKFHKTGIEDWLTMGSELGPFLCGIHSHCHYTIIHLN